MQFGEYFALAIHNNNSPLNGRIVAVGVGDLATATQFYPFTARIFIARYMPDGSLDTSFGINGRMVISALNDGKQIIAHAVAIDSNDNIYVGGDIADIGSGLAGAATFPTASSLGQIMARPSANFLLIKLNSTGIPVEFGPASSCNSAGSCLSTVFSSCSSCILNFNNSATTAGTFRAVTTDFKGFDDSIFALVVDDCQGTITAIGQASQASTLDSQAIGLARYFLKDGTLDLSFGTGGLTMVTSGSGFRTLARAGVKDPLGKKIIVAGQSAFGPPVFVTNFMDAEPTNFMVARINA